MVFFLCCVNRIVGWQTFWPLSLRHHSAAGEATRNGGDSRRRGGWRGHWCRSAGWVDGEGVRARPLRSRRRAADPRTHAGFASFSFSPGSFPAARHCRPPSDRFVCVLPPPPPSTMASEGAAVESTGLLTCQSIDLEDVRLDKQRTAGGQREPADPQPQRRASTCRPQRTGRSSMAAPAMRMPCWMHRRICSRRARRNPIADGRMRGSLF